MCIELIKPKNISIKLLCLIVVVLYFGTSNVSALTAEQKTLYKQGINFYDLVENECTPSNHSGSSSTDLTPGNGSPTGLTYPNLDANKMVDAIIKYIKERKPDSPFLGYGSNTAEDIITALVASSKKNNINPFLIIGHMEHENNFGDKNDYNVRKGNNAFGRTATSSQPNFKGDKLWYYWSSIKASVDASAPENIGKERYGGDHVTYYRVMYGSFVDKGDLNGLINKYAPASENDVPRYIRSVKSTISKLAKMAQDSKSTGDIVTSSDSSTDEEIALDENSCCSISSGQILEGKNNQEIVWNFLIQEMGLNQAQALGIMVNLQQESGFSTTATNPKSGAYGMVQWLGGRLTSLKAYAEKSGKPVSDINIQLEFMKQELEGSYKKAVLDPIKASDNFAEVTRIWLEKFEIPCTPGSSACDKEMDTRMAYKSKFSSFINGGSEGFNNVSVSASVCGESSSSIAISGVQIKKFSPALTTPGGKITPKGITLHWWGSNGSGGIQFLANALKSNSSCGAGGCSVQLGITKEGEVYQMTKDLLDLTYHASGANSSTIGIEIEGGPADFGKEGIAKYPKKYAAVVATVKMLMEKYNIPLEGDIVCNNVTGVHSHKDLKSCGNAGKTDIDDYYFNQVIKDVKGGG